jgi:hypothetical protein
MLWVMQGGKYMVRYNGDWQHDLPEVSTAGWQHCSGSVLQHYSNVRPVEPVGRVGSLYVTSSLVPARQEGRGFGDVRQYEGSNCANKWAPSLW